MDTLPRNDVENLRRISVDGARAAQLALRQMIGFEIDLEVLRVQTVAFADVPALLGGPEAPVVGIHLKVYGDARASVLLALPPAAAERILAALFPGAPALETAGELERSGLMELGNILTCSYLNALSGALRLSLVPGVPALAHDMAGAVVDVLLIEQGPRADAALVIQTELRASGGLDGHLLLMPDPASVPRLLEALHEAHDS